MFEVLRKFQGCFRAVLRVLTESFKGVSGKFKLSGKFQGGFKESPKGVQVRLMGHFK